MQAKSVTDLLGEGRNWGNSSNLEEFLQSFHVVLKMFPCFLALSPACFHLDFLFLLGLPRWSRGKESV